MFKTIALGLIAGVTLGVGGSLPFLNMSIEGLATGLIAITCIVIPVSFIILFDKKRVS